jgi:L-aminopeptidase/D-esterase-like protein
MKVRERGIVVGRISLGPNNCITDVPGVKIGHVTLDFPLDDKGEEYACTGVTAILPMAVICSKRRLQPPATSLTVLAKRLASSR